MRATKVRDSEVDALGLTPTVREAGDPDGQRLVYFQCTPWCRLEPAFADRPAAELAVSEGNMSVVEHASETLTGEFHPLSE
jgi:hypothetical protein